MPNKRDETDKRLFEALLQLRRSICSLNSFKDFERVIRNAFLTVFPNYFIYLTVCFNLNNRTSGKLARMAEMFRIRMTVFALNPKCFNDLAFLPPSKVIAASQLLLCDDDILYESICFF